MMMTIMIMVVVVYAHADAMACSWGGMSGHSRVFFGGLDYI